MEALQKQTYIEIMSIAPQEVNITDPHYREVLTGNYKAMQSDLKEQGIIPQFSQLDNKVADAVMRSQWFDGNYASRIWSNTKNSASEIPNIVGGGLTSGQSYQRTAQILKERFDVARYQAVRLVRTETNYFNGQAELQSYVDDGIQEYDFDAILDGRTSKICQDLNGQRFLVKDAMPGKNYPPMQGNCRSTTAVVFPGEAIIKPTPKQRIERLDIGPSNKSIASDMAGQMAFDLQN